MSRPKAGRPRPVHRMSLPRPFRLTRRRDYELVRMRGRSQGGRLLAVAVLEQPTVPRVKAGIIVPKALGSAVTRNLIKRRLREIVRSSLGELAVHQFVVTIARRGAVDADFATLVAEWKYLVRRLRALDNPESSRP